MIFVLITILLFVLVCIICLFTRLWLQNKLNRDSEGIVIPASFVCWVGFICGLVFCAFSVFSLLDNEEVWVPVCFACFGWLAIGIMFGWLGTIITYDRDGFTVGWLPWQRSHFRYNELTSMKKTNHSRILFCGKKKITLDYMLINDYYFEAYALRRYKEVFGNDLPYNNDIPKWDIFKGHLDSPEEFIFIDILLLVITLVMPLWQVYEAFDNVTENETTYIELRVSSYETDEDTLILKSEQYNADFELWGYKNYEKPSRNIMAVIQSNQNLGINVIVLEEENNIPIRYEIYNIENNAGEIILSFDEVNE